MFRMLARKGYLSKNLGRTCDKRVSEEVIEQAISFGKSKGMINDDQELDRLVQKEQRKGEAHRQSYTN